MHQEVRLGFPIPRHHATLHGQVEVHEQEEVLQRVAGDVTNDVERPSADGLVQNLKSKYFTVIGTVI